MAEKTLKIVLGGCLQPLFIPEDIPEEFREELRQLPDKVVRTAPRLVAYVEEYNKVPDYESHYPTPWLIAEIPESATDWVVTVHREPGSWGSYDGFPEVLWYVLDGTLHKIEAEALYDERLTFPPGYRDWCDSEWQDLE